MTISVQDWLEAVAEINMLRAERAENAELMIQAAHTINQQTGEIAALLKMLQVANRAMDIAVETIDRKEAQIAEARADAERWGRSLDIADERIDSLTDDNVRLQRALDERVSPEYLADLEAAHESRINELHRTCAMVAEARDSWRDEYTKLEAKYSLLMRQMGDLVRNAMNRG